MSSESNQLIQYRDASGKTLSLTLESTEPLTLQDIEEVISKKGEASLNVKFSGEEVLDGNSESAPKNINASMDINFHRDATVYCLTKGGWLPPVFIDPTVFIIDKNILIKLEKFANNESRLDYEVTNWWLQFPLKMVINPVLYAMEGCNQSIPSFSEFYSQFEKASESIKKLLPNVEVTSYTEIHYQAAYEQVSMFKERSEIEAAFLMEISPLLKNRCSGNNLESTKKKILSVADKFGLVKPSLVLIIALARLYERKNGSGLLIGQRIIKPNASYSLKDAFNAISDLRAIEILISSMCFDDEKNASLMTCDIGIAAFWCALNPRNFRTELEKPKFEVSLNLALFPRMKLEELNELSLDIL